MYHFEAIYCNMDMDIEENDLTVSFDINGYASEASEDTCYMAAMRLALNMRKKFGTNYLLVSLNLISY